MSLLQGQGRGRRHPHGLFDARRAAHRRDGAGARGRVLRHRLRDDDAADRARHPRRREEGPHELLVFCNHVLTPAAIQTILESPDVRELGSVRDRRLHRPGACLAPSSALQPYRVLRRGIREAGRGRGLRAARRDAGDPDAGPPGQRRPARGREPVYPRGRRAKATEGAGRGRRGLRAARELRMARPRRRALQRAAPARRLRRASTPSGASASTTMPAHGQSGLRMRRDPARRQEAARLQAVRHRLHARDADGLVHGLVRRRLRGALDLWPLPRDAKAAQRRSVA